MPLIRCPDCAKEISDAAPACPHCGRPATAKALPKHFKPKSTTDDAVELPPSVFLNRIREQTSYGALRSWVATTSVLGVIVALLAIICGVSVCLDGRVAIGLIEIASGFSLIGSVVLLRHLGILAADVADTLIEGHRRK